MNKRIYLNIKFQMKINIFYISSYQKKNALINSPSPMHEVIDILNREILCIEELGLGM